MLVLRQGDVLLVKSAIPEKAEMVKRERGVPIVLAFGETTGHSHKIAEPGVQVFEHEGTRWIRVPKKGAELRHEEHAEVALEVGDYSIVIQKEYSPAELRNVRD